jgi:glycosyltransferase involved in cell wall biosynthesis
VWSNEYYQVPYVVVDKEKLLASIERLRGRDVVIYGAGSYGLQMLNWLWSADIRAICFCDGDVKKQGKTYYGLETISPRILKKKYAHCAIAVAVHEHQAAIRSTFAALGVNNDIIEFLPLTWSDKYNQIPLDAVEAEQVGTYGWRIERARKLEPAMSAKGDAGKALIVTWAYNVPAYYLRRCVESVLNQAYANFTYLLLDNGSTDGSADIIREYARHDKRIEVVTFKTNIWQLSSAEVTAIARSVANDYLTDDFAFISSVDTDDYLDPRYLSESIRLAVKHSADMVIVNTLGYEEKFPQIATWNFVRAIFKEAYHGKDEIIAVLCRYGYFNASIWGKLCKPRVFRNLYLSQFDTHNLMVVFADVWASAKAVADCNTVVFTDEILHYWTRRYTSHSFRPAISDVSRMVVRWFDMVEMLESLLRKYGADSEENLIQTKEFMIYQMAFREDVLDLEHAKDTCPDAVRQNIQAALADNRWFAFQQDYRCKDAIARLRSLLEEIGGGQ